MLGELVKLFPKGGALRTDSPVPLWSDLKIELTEVHGKESPGALYAKVLRRLAEGQAEVYVHFTYVPPEIASFFQRLLVVDAPAGTTPSQRSG